MAVQLMSVRVTLSNPEQPITIQLQIDARELEEIAGLRSMTSNTAKPLSL